MRKLVLVFVLLGLFCFNCFADDTVTKLDNFRIRVITPIVQETDLSAVIARRDKLADDILKWEAQVIDNRTTLQSDLARLNAVINESIKQGVVEKPTIEENVEPIAVEAGPEGEGIVKPVNKVGDNG